MRICFDITYEFDVDTELKMVKYYEEYIYPYRDKVIALHLYETFIINKFFSICTIDSSFTNLQSIIVNDISSLKFAVLLFYFRNLPCLYSLTIVINETDEDEIGDIYRMTFQLSALKYFKFEISNRLTHYLDLPKATPTEQSSIEYLSIRHHLTIDDLSDLLTYTPHLKHLNCMTCVQSNSLDLITNPIPLKDLVHVSLSIDQISFNIFEQFLLQIGSQLRVLSLAVYQSDFNYLDPIRWENLILKRMPHLQRFRFHFNEKNDDEFDVKPLTHSLIGGFHSSFWLDRRWFFRISIDSHYVVHSILPDGFDFLLQIDFICLFFCRICLEDGGESLALVDEATMNDGASMTISFYR